MATNTTLFIFSLKTKQVIIMGDVNFSLRNDIQAKTGKALIQLTFRYPYKQRLRFTWGDALEPHKWDPKRQRVKNTKETNSTGEYFINDLLDRLEKELLNIYHLEKINSGYPKPQILASKLRAFMNQSQGVEAKTDLPNFFSLLDRFIAGEIVKRGEVMKLNTIKNYQTAKGHLIEFQNKTGYKVDFDSINMEFFDRFVLFLKRKKIHKYTGEPGLSNNTIAKTIAVIKTVMNRAVLLKYTINLEFKNPEFHVPEISPDAIYLNDDEILKFYRFDLSDHPRLERVRDLFVFGCFVGLRFSDYSNVKPENIIEIEGDKYIKIITQKTGELVYIPCNPIVLEIFHKYQKNTNNLPESISDVKFNSYLKEAGLMAGFTEKGRLSEYKEEPLYKLLTSHVARRSFATNLYVQGFPSYEIMKITGHKTELSFKKYLRIDKLNAAKMLNEHIKKNWSKFSLRVAS